MGLFAAVAMPALFAQVHAPSTYHLHLAVFQSKLLPNSCAKLYEVLFEAFHAAKEVNLLNPLFKQATLHALPFRLYE